MNNFSISRGLDFESTHVPPRGYNLRLLYLLYLVVFLLAFLVASVHANGIEAKSSIDISTSTSAATGIEEYLGMCLVFLKDGAGANCIVAAGF